MYNRKLHFHFTGIAGSGMAGIAELLLNQGFRVSGSDLRSCSASQRLETLGAHVCQGHAAENLPEDCSLVVYSSAIAGDNPELLEARRRGLPVVRRAEVLAELVRLKYSVAVAGSHGKTSTTSMIGQVLERGGLDPTVILGGVLKTFGSGARLGSSDYLVAESDESDRSFLLLRPTIAIVTNIDAEHLDAYKSWDELEEAFSQFVNSVPFYGVAVFCMDDLRAARLACAFRGRKISYGIANKADWEARDVELSTAGACYQVYFQGGLAGAVNLPIPARHMVLNSLAAIAVGHEFGISFEQITQALGNFSGVKRRLELVGRVGSVSIISDYGHHPTEIKATLVAVREAWGQNGKVHVVFQPHRYSRTRACFDQFRSAFNDADTLYMTEIYSAGEVVDPSVSGKRLCEAINGPQTLYVPTLEELPAILADSISEGDVIICLGAGSIGAFAEQLAEQLNVLACYQASRQAAAGDY